MGSCPVLVLVPPAMLPVRVDPALTLLRLQLVQWLGPLVEVKVGNLVNLLLSDSPRWRPGSRPYFATYCGQSLYGSWFLLMDGGATLPRG